MKHKPNSRAVGTDLRRRAEVRLTAKRLGPPSKGGRRDAGAETARVLHELEVHRIELEMQNEELQDARDRMESLLEKYTDLYDFAPVGYFSLDDHGSILEVNLTGAAMLGVERSRLIDRRLPATAASQPILLAFLKRVFTGTGKHVCEAALMKANAEILWASLHGISAPAVGESGKWCRVAISDITSLRQAEEAQRRMETLAAANRELRREIARRRAVEAALKTSEQHQNRLLDRSRQMQEQLRHLSHQILQAQEEERKRISRELHDEIAQTLTGINVRLAGLKAGATTKGNGLQKKITSTQRLVEKSVQIVHRFARELRPSVLDDLGLIPALHSYVKVFAKRARLRVRLTIFAGVEQLESAKRTVLYRVAQEALTNVARHAHATEVEINIEKTSDSVRMKIRDNGRSFVVHEMLHARKTKRLGLLGMRERAEMVGGSFTVESASDRGTTIDVRLPLAPPRKKL